MRTLRFIVDGQIVRQDPTCNFDDLVPGTEQYLRAEFAFSPEWNDYVKVAAFYSVMGLEYPPQILKNGKSCVIPAEALKKRIFKVKIVGKNGDFTLVTNKLEIHQKGGKT